LRASERDEAEVAKARQGWRDEAAAIAPERLVFLDESAALTDLTRAYAWSRRGARACGTAPGGRRERVTIPGALGLEGVLGAMSVAAATDGAVFHAYLDQVLLPELRRTKPDAVIVMDNLAAHKATAVRALLDGSGLAYRYLPPYSPDLNPIEMAWAKAKGLLRTAAARTVDGLHQALGPALHATTEQDAQGFFRHAGYARPNQPAVRSSPDYSRSFGVLRRQQFRRRQGRRGRKSHA
jgi:transposase